MCLLPLNIEMKYCVVFAQLSTFCALKMVNLKIAEISELF